MTIVVLSELRSQWMLSRRKLVSLSIPSAKVHLGGDAEARRQCVGRMKIQTLSKVYLLLVD